VAAWGRRGDEFDHYSLPNATDAMLGIGTYLGASAGATGMRPDFGL
jgi:hypothetical protein